MIENDSQVSEAAQQIGVCLDKVVIPSGAKRSRGIYTFRFAFWLIWREDPSTLLRSAQDDKVFCCLGLPEKHHFIKLLS